MGRLPLVCHIPKPQQLPRSVRLSARSASPRPRPRAAPRLRVTRGTCRAQLHAIQSRSLLVQISGRRSHRRSGTTGAYNRVAQPDRSLVLEQAQRGLPFVTCCESHRELDRPPPVQSDRQQRSCQHPSWRVTKSGAGLRLIWPSRPRRDQGRSTKRTDDGPPRHSTAPDPHEDPEVHRQPRRALGARPPQQ
jgi:hypothetical protein